MTANLNKLADRVERAGGPDRELDALIVTSLCPGATVSEYIRGEGDDIVFHAEALGIRNKDCCPWYTASLDAAMTLVPEGHDWVLCDHRATYGTPFVIIKSGDDRVEDWTGRAVTPALALVSACLKARAALTDVIDDAGRGK